MAVERCKHGCCKGSARHVEFDQVTGVYITSGGTHYHARASCYGLSSGQDLVDARAGTTAPIIAVSRFSDEIDDRDPCAVCRPPARLAPG